jgi:hypothetical protein
MHRYSVLSLFVVLAANSPIDLGQHFQWDVPPERQPSWQATCVTKDGTCTVTFNKPTPPGTSCSCGDKNGRTK